MMQGFKNEIGDTLDIYQKPVTHEDFEGRAKLIKPIAVCPDGEYWVVEFEGEPNSYYNRQICEH